MKRLFYLLIGLVLLPAFLYAQGTLSLKDINDNLINNYYTKTTSDAKYAVGADTYDTAEVDAKLADKADTDSVYTKTANDILLALKADKTYVNATDESIIASLYSYALKSYVNATDETIILDNDSQDVTIEASRVGVASLEVSLQTHQNNLSNPHQVTATQTTYTDTYSIAATTVQSAIDTLEAWLGGFVTDSFVYGFVEPVTATLSYDASTQTFTITGSHEVYINGKRVTKGTASKTHPATTGTHYFYYDSDGVLQTSTSPWNNDFFNVCHIAYVYYNASKVSAPKGLLFDEEHSYIMTTATHYYLHTTRGAVSSDLFPLGNYSTAPAVPTDAGNQFSATGGTLTDEDHRETIADVPDGGYYPIFWREGVAGEWTWQSGTYPVLVGTNYPKYNQLTGGSWTTTEVSANNYINMYTAVTNAADSTYSVILIMGQNVYSTLALAQAANPINTLSLGNLPFNEIIITNKITFRSSGGYATIGKCRIESVESLAGITIRLGGAVTATSHSGLSNRTDPGSHPASAISYVDTYDLGVTDVQSALDTIELWLSAIDVTDDSQDVAINAHLINTVGAHAATAISATWTNVQVSLDSIEAAIQGIVVGSGFATEAWTNATLETNFYNKTETNATIEAAIAAIPAPSVNQTVTVPAGEALTAGQVVSLINESGTVRAYNNALTVSTSPNGAESVFNSAATTYCSAAKLTDTTFAVIFFDGSNTQMIAGSVSGSTITWGSQINIVSTGNHISICYMKDNQVLIAWCNTTTHLIRVGVVTASGTTLTYQAGANAYTSGGATDPTYTSLSKIDTDKAVLCFKKSSTDSSYGSACVITLSGNTPTANTVADFNAAATAYISCSALSSTSAIVAYQDAADNDSKVQILTISGTTITPNTEYSYDGTNDGVYQCVTALSSTSAFAITTRTGDAYGYYSYLSISGTAITPTTATKFSELYPGCDGGYTVLSKIDATHVLLADRFINDSAKGSSVLITLSGTTATFGTPSYFNAASTNYVSTCYLGSNKTVIAYMDDTNSDYGEAVVNTWATSSYASVSGLSQGAYSSGSDAVVLISGVSDDQGGLITGSPYFLQTDFTIGTTPVSLTPTSLLNAGITGEVKVGTAKSATELIIGIDYK